MFNSWERRLFFALLATIIWAAAMQIEAIGIASTNFQKPKECSYFVGQPIADVELARSEPCFIRVVQQGDYDSNLAQNAQAIRTNTHMDFAFIALYWWVVVCFAKLDWQWWSRGVAGLVSVAALFDLLENWRILSCVRELLATGQVRGMLPWHVSVVKWIAFGVALAVLGAGRLICEGGFWRRILPLLLLAAGVMTVAGIQYPWALSVVLFGAGLLIGLAQFWPWSWNETLVGIEYAYLMRFQLLSATILAAGLPVLYRLAPSVFTGLFDGRGFWSFAFIVWAAFQLAWTVMVTVRMVLVYGPERFVRMQMGDGGEQATGAGNVGPGTTIGFGTLALPAVVVLWYGSEFRQFSHPATLKLLATLLGLSIGIGVLLLTARLHFAIEPSTRDNAQRIFPSFGLFATKGQISGWKLWKWAGKQLAKLPSDLTQGILDGNRLRSGHEMATIALLVFLAIYVGVGAAFWPTLVSPGRQPSAIFYLLFLVTVFTWLLPGAAFFLDRTRLPVFATLLAVSLLTGFYRTDHEYIVSEAYNPDGNTLGATDVVHYWEHGSRGTADGPIVIVATAGGGIRAAAWTAEVVTRLQNQCTKNEFSNALLLVSSVSGGSVGSMNVVAAYDEQGKYTPDLQSIQANAARSSLSAVGWGMAYPDLARTAPVLGELVPQRLDRGWSLENAWAWSKPGKANQQEDEAKAPTMRQWRMDVTKGTRPAVIFNATVSENGDRFLIASTDARSAGTKRFFELYPNADIEVATAARLSATFPYVTPLARAWNEPAGTAFHIGDGGYYDNSGLLSVVEWLNEAAPALQKHKVVLILIDAKAGQEASGQSWSWQRQIAGPLETLLNVRTSSQQLRDSTELNVARKYLATLNVKICPAVFLFQSTVPAPLSWHLTPSQIDAVHESWKYGDNPQAEKFVYGELGCSER